VVVGRGLKRFGAGVFLFLGLLLGASAQAQELITPGAAREIAPKKFGIATNPLGTPDLSLSIAFGWAQAGRPMPLNQGLDPAISAFLQNVVTSSEADGTDISTASATDATRIAHTGDQPVCGDDFTAIRLQTASESWDKQALSGPVAQFPLGVMKETTEAVEDPTGIGPLGNRANVQKPGHAGAWCRPLPLPFSESSPLASTMFWIMVGLAAMIVIVFWLTRGVKLPSI
jgi:hypothetical protein